MSTRATAGPADTAVLEHAAIDRLLGTLAGRGYAVVGPTIRDGVVVYAEIASEADLPVGWVDEQAPGRYRLRQTGDGAAFACRPGMASWKQFLHPPELVLCRMKRAGRAFTVEGAGPPPRPLALFGARPCELAAVAIQDRALLEGPFPDRGYAARRRDLFVVAVDCTEPGSLCFCDSMAAGPRATGGFDVALTELPGEGGPVILARGGSERGREVLDELPSRPATAEEVGAAQAALDRAAASQRRVATRGLRERLRQRYGDARWEEVARRCLACGNCTLACPTCFCTTVEDSCSLDGAEACRVRRWDSCFSPEFSYVHGGSVRASVAGRYRHWVMHKFATWHDQFGSVGCVGCARCVTWCPAGIDLVEELGALAPGEGGAP